MLLLLRKIELLSIENIIKYYKNDNTGKEYPFSSFSLSSV